MPYWTRIFLLVGLIVGMNGATTSMAVAQQDPVRDTVGSIGEAFGKVFDDLGDSLGRAGDDIERLFTGSSRRVVDFDRKYKKGTIVISTNQRRLYLVLDRGHALRYSVGVGREGFQWGGKSHNLPQGEMAILAASR